MTACPYIHRLNPKSCAVMNIRKSGALNIKGKTKYAPTTSLKPSRGKGQIELVGEHTQSNHRRQKKQECEKCSIEENEVYPKVAS